MSGIGHGGGALQRHAVSPPAGREHRRDLLHRQRGSVRHLLQNPEVDHAHLRRLEPPGLGHHVRRHHLLALPRPIERRLEKVGREYGAVPAPPLLHARIRAADVARLAAVPRAHCARAHAADVRRQEHDGRL